MPKTKARPIPFPVAVRPSQGGRPAELPRPWCTLAADLGGVAKLARRCGVSVRTIERWSRGVRPSAIAQAFVRGLFVRRGCLTSEPWPPLEPRAAAPVIRLVRHAAHKSRKSHPR